MKNETVFALLVIFYAMVVRNVMSDCHATMQRVLEGNYNGKTSEFVIWLTSFHSRIGCVHKCYRDPRCITLQHVYSGGYCIMYAANLDLLRAQRTGGASRVVTLQLKFRGGYGGECASDTECQFSNSECRQSACACIQGYAFNPVKYACTNGCATYGRSFETFTGIAVNATEFATYTFGTLEECLKYCATNTNCKTFDYMESTKQCLMKSAGGLDTFFTPKDGNVHGVRNCFD